VGEARRHRLIMGGYRNGVRVPTTIFEAAALHYSVWVKCGRCARVEVFEPAGLWWHFHRKGWSDHFAHAAEHLYCAKCSSTEAKVRPAVVEAVSGPPTVTLRPPSDREWKRATSRFRT